MWFIFRLDKDLLVKVADFGLSRDVYIQDYYKTQHNVPLPVKWLAPEALFDREFSTKTDVVSVICISLTYCIIIITLLFIVGIWSNMLGNIFTWTATISIHWSF